MKKLLFILSLMIGSLLLAQTEKIDECKTDIYFGNGVWNSEQEAIKSAVKLQEIIDREIIKNDSKLKAKYGKIKYQYNYGISDMIDLLETFYQLKEAGQIKEEDFFGFIDTLILSVEDDIEDEDVKAMRQQIINMLSGVEEDNIDKMLIKYYEESFKYGHRVLLVSHSQGNMFANRIYEKINPTEYKNYFANLQVASPASEVKASKGDYVTGFVDPIINPIPGSMSSNADLDFPGGHKFVEAYLASSDTLTKIINGTSKLLNDLDKEQSQWQTDQEFNKGSKNYKITVHHRFDSNIIAMQNVEVYPFNPSQKLYQVKDETGGNGWVKASCSGEEIFDYWDEQKDNEFYLINNSEMEKIMNGGFSFTIKYLLEFATYGYNWNSYIKPEYIKQNTACEFYIIGYGSGLGEPVFDQEYYFNTVLPHERSVHESYALGDNNQFIKCMLNEEGYEFSDIDSITRGEEKKYTIYSDGVHNYQQYFGYVLEQEYRVNPKQ
jgi:hypothetical protein